MSLFKIFVALFLPILSPILPFSILLDSDESCSPANILCLSENSFTYCSTADDVFFLSKSEWFCPTGFICSSSGDTPCIAVPSLTTTTTEPTTTTLQTTTPEITTTPETTTTTTVAPTTTTPQTTTTAGTTTTVGPPSCSSHSYSKGPTCSQYYECVQFLWWFNAELKSCATGYYFSLSQSACVLPEESDCT